MHPPLTADTLIRLASFLGVFALVALWEWLAPRRAQAVGRAKRWQTRLMSTETGIK